MRLSDDDTDDNDSGGSYYLLHRGAIITDLGNGPITQPKLSNPITWTVPGLPPEKVSETRMNEGCKWSEKYT